MRSRILVAAAFLLAVAVVGSTVIIRNLRGLVRNQQLIVFKDRIFHDHERARELIQAAQAKLYQHQAGYTHDIDQLVNDIAEFETIITSITPHYREHYRALDCNTCHSNGLRKIEHLEEVIRDILFNLERYRESVSVVITTNDRNARVLHNGIANTRGEEILAAIRTVNYNAGLMVQQLRVESESILLRSEKTIEASVAVIGLIFLVTVVYLVWGFNRLLSSLLQGTASMTRDDFSHRLPLASRRDELGLLASRFNLMAEHLQERDRLIGEKTAQLESANEQLKYLNENLEQKVRDRTAELETTLQDVRRATQALEESKRQVESANQELLRANQAKANFLSIISHELKTPLSVINGFLSLILDERYQNDPQHLREAIQISKRRGEQLSRMIDELIDLSRLDARSMALRREATAGDLLLREVGAHFQEEFRRKQLRLSLRLPDALPTLVCDPDKLRQIFTNLVENAVKFSQEGGEVELGAEDRGGELLFWVRDTGIGITPEEQDKIFEKFYQVDSSATRRFGGAGLGLSIVKEMVLLHGGRVRVESVPGGGSTFFVALPKVPPAGDLPDETTPAT
jgi:signal transduction histidine kinase